MTDEAPKITLEEVSNAKRNLEREIFAKIDEFEALFGIRIQEAQLINNAYVSVVGDGCPRALGRIFSIRVDL